jgi:hypothetical protein
VATLYQTICDHDRQGANNNVLCGFSPDHLQDVLYLKFFFVYFSTCRIFNG